MYNLYWGIPLWPERQLSAKDIPTIASSYEIPYADRLILVQTEEYTLLAYDLRKLSVVTKEDLANFRAMKRFHTIHLFSERQS